MEVAAIEKEMTRFTPTRTPHTGDENPGGTIRRDGGFGWKTLVIGFQRVTRSMGEAWRKSGQRAENEAGGLRPSSRFDRHAVRTGIMRGTRSAQAGGPVGVFHRGISAVAFDEVVFSSRPVPGGIGR